MAKDPDYLSHLGELATLKNAISSSFHQDALVIHENMDAVVRDFWTGYDEGSALLLENQIETALQQGNEVIQELWDRYSDWGTNSPHETRKVFELLLEACPNAPRAA